MFCHSNLQEDGVSLSAVIHSLFYLKRDWLLFCFFLVGSGGGGLRRVTGAWPVPLVGAEVKAVPATIIQSHTALKLQQDCRCIIAATFITIIISTFSIQGICCS
jgi:hypothetical protein